MLADAKGTKTIGIDEYWKVFVNDMCKLEQGKLPLTIGVHLLPLVGVRMTVNDRECLVICIGMFLLADTPALKEMIGLSPSVSSTCYVRMPCKSCEVLIDDLSTSIRPHANCTFRREDTYMTFYRLNNFCTGPPISVGVREMMKEFGILRVSEFIRLPGLMSPHKLGTDTMHTVDLGVLKHHFIHVVTSLTSVQSGCTKDFGNVWESISRRFRSYCVFNGISSCWKFSSAKEFKSRVKAGSMRELARVSPFIFYVIGLVDLKPSDNRVATRNRWKKHIRVFNFWVLHVKIADMLHQHTFSVKEVTMLEKAIEKLLEYFFTDFPRDFVTINVHYYIHLVDQIRRMGPMRIAANSPRERIIQQLKPRYKNVATIAKEITIYGMYLDNLLFEALDCLEGRSATYRRYDRRQAIDTTSLSNDSYKGSHSKLCHSARLLPLRKNMHR